MIERQKSIIRRAALTVAALGLLIPVTVSPGQSPQANDACANGACCREMLSTCGVGEDAMPHYYEDLEGDCELWES